MTCRVSIRCLGVVQLGFLLAAGCKKHHDNVLPISSTNEGDARSADVEASVARSQFLAKGRAPIAVGPSSVVFMGTPTRHQLSEVSKDGGSPVLLTMDHAPRGFALDERGLFFVDDAPNGLFGIANGTSTIVTLAGSTDYRKYYIDGDFIVTHAGYVYWLSGRTSTHESGIMRVRESGGATSLIAAGLGQFAGLAVDDAYVYVTCATGVVAAPVGGGAQSTLAAPEHAMGMIAVNGAHVYWLTWDWKDEANWEKVWHLNRVPMGGGSKEVVLSDASSTNHLFALTTRAIYWVNENELHRADLDGRNDAMLEPADGGAIAADDANVYFTNGGEIRRLAQ